MDPQQNTFPQALTHHDEILQIGDEAYYSVSQTAAALRITPSAVKRLIAYGVLEPIMTRDLVLISESSISRQIANSRSWQW